MKERRIYINASSLSLVLFLWVGICNAQSIQQFPYNRYIKVGDDPAWSDPNYDHSQWNNWGHTDTTGIFWLRFELKSDSFTTLFKQPGMQIISLGAYECYWDGTLIAENGKVGSNKRGEVPGYFSSQIKVADSLLIAGRHLIAFRVSNFHKPFAGTDNWNTLYLEEYQRTRIQDLKRTAWMFILAGLYLMTALYYLFLFILRKREAIGLIFSIICFLFLGLIVMEYSKFLFDYLYPFHHVRLIYIFGITLGIASLMPLFFLIYFKVPYKWIWLVIVLIAYAVITHLSGIGFDQTNQTLSAYMWNFSTLILVYAYVQQKKGSRLILIAFLLIGAIVKLMEQSQGYASGFAYDVSLFIGFSMLVLAMMYLLAVRAREQKQAYEASLLLSARLQNQLLKKNIQPHFIMNTLTSLMEWIEESPKDSVAFIEALAGEFEIMSEIAEKKMIPIQQELDLIQQHITIMKYRKEVDYQFEYSNIDLEELIPPAIFHTIIENGISHSIPNTQNQIKMVLESSRQDKKIIYTISTYANNRKKESKGDGTGLKYIRSRLQENYEDRWELSSQATEFGWQTQITLG